MSVLALLRTSRSVLSVRSESPVVKTFTVRDKLCSKAKPGQFLMLWIPRVDEIPLSVLGAGDGEVSVTVKAVGEAIAGELRKVKIRYRCSICGTEVRMTAANDEVPEAPRHCQEDMDLVAPIE